MSFATRAYLIVVTVAFSAWFGWTFLGAGSLAGERGGPRFTSDPSYLLQNASRLRGGLNGRVVLADQSGAFVELPPGAVVVVVHGVDSEGELFIERRARVEPDGFFEVLGLPFGRADVAVEFGAGGLVKAVTGVEVRRSGSADPRLHPIDISAEVTPYSLQVVAADGEPVFGGHLAWRPTHVPGQPAALGREPGGAVMNADMDAESFGGVVPIRGGAAQFLASAGNLDIVALVPGAATEFFDCTSTGDQLDLGPGTTLDLQVVGERPPTDIWRIRAVLRPDVESPAAWFDPSLSAAVESTWRPPAADLDSEGRAKLHAIGGGTFSLRYIVGRHGPRRTNEMSFDDPSGEPVVLMSNVGDQSLVRSFPMAQFQERLAERSER